MRRLTNSIDRVLEAYERSSLKQSNFAIVSNNCWGSDLYKSTARPYNTPFVGLYLFPDCYLRLLAELPEALTRPITVSTESRYIKTPPYPIGHLGDAEIHFMHYLDPVVAAETWRRRAARLSEYLGSNSIVIYKFCDRSGANSVHFAKFASLKAVRKVAFSSVPEPGSVLVDRAEVDLESHSVVDGVTLYANRYKYFDLPHFIKTGEKRAGGIPRWMTRLRRIVQ